MDSSRTPLVGNGAERADPCKRARQTVYHWVEGNFDSPLEYFILYLIFAQTLLLMVSTMKADPDPECMGRDCLRLGDKYETFFEACEFVSVLIFTVEYCLRVWVCVEHPCYDDEYSSSWKARLMYCLNFFSMIDLLSIAPYWISALPMVDESPDFITAIRVFRLIRLFKADKYINAFQMLGTVLAENYSLLVATSFYSMLAWFISAALLYFTECGHDTDGNFESIPSALFPTLLMLTGEFPISDFSVPGRFVAGFIALVAVAIFAVPTAVLGSGFIKAVQQARQLEFTVDA